MKLDHNENVYFSAVLCAIGFIILIYPVVRTANRAFLLTYSGLALLIMVTIILSLPRKQK